MPNSVKTTLLGHVSRHKVIELKLMDSMNLGAQFGSDCLHRQNFKEHYCIRLSD